MLWYEAGGILIGMVIVMLALGIPVALTFLTANIIGTMVFIGGFNGLRHVVDNSTALITNFALAPVPLFILMGSLFFHTGLALGVFDALDKLFGRVPGRLCYLTVVGGASFSTLTGSSMANTAMLGSLMMPEMRRRGYSQKMTMGPILGTGGLAMIIPPSSLAVLLASIGRVDVGHLLIAGLLPGVVLAGLYSAMVYLQVRRDPGGAPGYDLTPASLREKMVAVVTKILPMGLVVFMVIGFILLGISTPTEAAAFGVLGVLVLAALYRKLTWNSIVVSLTSTVRVAAMVFFILLSSTVFSELLAYTGASSGLLKWATGFDFPPHAILLMMFVILLALGMFMDPVSMLLITVPIFFPLAAAIGFDLVWFGLIVLMAVEMSGTTPPFGLLLYIMLGVAPPGTTLMQVARAAAPFLLCDAVLVALLVLFPNLALFLPRVMD